MTVLFLDLGAAYRELAVEIDAAVARVTSSGWYIGGEEVAQFERSFAAYCSAAHCVGVGNGLDALQLALRACGVGPGAEVIVEYRAPLADGPPHGNSSRSLKVWSENPVLGWSATTMSRWTWVSGSENADGPR